MFFNLKKRIMCKALAGVYHSPDEEGPLRLISSRNRTLFLAICPHRQFGR